MSDIPEFVTKEIDFQLAFDIHPVSFEQLQDSELNIPLKINAKIIRMRFKKGRLQLSLSSNGFNWDIADEERGKKRDYLPGVSYHIELTHELARARYVLKVNDVEDIVVKSVKSLFGAPTEGR
jgi:hypothetical protein